MSFLRIVWFGVLTLTFSMLPSIFFLNTEPHALDFFCYDRSMQNISPSSFPELCMNFGLLNHFSALSIGNARGQLAFSVDPRRPDSKLNTSQLMIRLAQSKQSKRIEYPARVELEFSEGVLQFSDRISSFWLLCSPISEGEISATLFYKTPEGKEVTCECWTVLLQDTPIQSAEEFSPASPFRELGETRWLGRDLVLEKYAGGEAVHRIEIGPSSGGELIECTLKDWLIFKEKKWQKVPSLEGTGDFPIAHLKNTFSQGLEFEGWDGSAHVRIKLVSSPPHTLNVRGDELFTQLRVRSEKQVSCMLDKQCLILRPNDWTLKTKGRWKILRKQEEKTAFLEGKLSGDLFVLDRIEAKGMIKSVAGHYFSAERSQMIPIEVLQKPSVKKGAERK